MAGHIATSTSVHWCTPQWVVDCIHELYNGPPDLDPCSNPYSTVKATTEFSLETGFDGLITPWAGHNIYVNPPFGKGWWKMDVNNVREYIWPSDREVAKKTMTKKDFVTWTKQYKPVSIGTWIERCAIYGGSENVVGLVPSYPGTKAWQKHVWKRSRAIFFPEGRLYFRLITLQPDGSLEEKTGPCPMDMAMPLWTPHQQIVDRFGEVFSKHGHVQVL